MPSTTASLPSRDHLPRLERVGDDPEEALAGAAALRVDVVLHLVDVARLQADAVHLVARVALQRIELAEHAVLDEQVHVEAQPAPPRALDPAVVGLLVRHQRRGSASPRTAASRTGRGRCSPRARVSRTAPQPSVAVWSGQSTSAYGAPYGCHGRPQCADPPRNSNAIPWMCASIRPRTSPKVNGAFERRAADVQLDLGVLGAAGRRGLPSVSLPSPSSDSSSTASPASDARHSAASLGSCGRPVRPSGTARPSCRGGTAPARSPSGGTGPAGAPDGDLEAAVRDRVLRLRRLRGRGEQHRRPAAQVQAALMTRSYDGAVTLRGSASSRRSPSRPPRRPGGRRRRRADPDRAARSARPRPTRRS